MLCAVLNKFEYRIDIHDSPILTILAFMPCFYSMCVRNREKKTEKERRGGFNNNLRNFNSMH